MRVEWRNRVEDGPTPTSDMGYQIAVDFDVEDDWDPQYISHSAAIDVRSCLRGIVLAIQVKYRLYALDVLVNAGGVFRPALLSLKIIGKRRKLLEQRAPPQTPAQELESEMSCLRESSMMVTTSEKVDACLQGELADSPAQNKRKVEVLHAQADADRDMRYAAVRNRSHVQWILDAERQLRRSVERFNTELRGHVTDHSSLAD